MSTRPIYWALLFFLWVFGLIYSIFGVEYFKATQKITQSNLDMYQQLEASLKNPADVKKEIKTQKTKSSKKSNVVFLKTNNTSTSQQANSQQAQISGDKEQQKVEFVKVIQSQKNSVEFVSWSEQSDGLLQSLRFVPQKEVVITQGVSWYKLNMDFEKAYEHMLELVSMPWWTGNVRLLSVYEIKAYNMPGNKVAFLNLDKYKGKQVLMLVDTVRGLWFLTIDSNKWWESLKAQLKDYFSS